MVGHSDQSEAMMSTTTSPMRYLLSRFTPAAAS
jgi:hypothetical protein